MNTHRSFRPAPHRSSINVPALALGMLLGALGMSGSASLQVPAQPPRDQRPVSPRPVPSPQPRDVRPGSENLIPIGKGIISGTVVVMGSGQPARRARVTLAGAADVGGSRSATTDDNGRFTFQALPE